MFPSFSYLFSILFCFRSFWFLVGWSKYYPLCPCHWCSYKTWIECMQQLLGDYEKSIVPGRLGMRTRIWSTTKPVVIFSFFPFVSPSLSTMQPEPLKWESAQRSPEEALNSASLFTERELKHWNERVYIFLMFFYSLLMVVAEAPMGAHWVGRVLVLSSLIGGAVSSRRRGDLFLMFAPSLSSQ